MLDQATKNWVKNQMASGYTRQQLESILRKKQYSEEDIKAAFASAEKAGADRASAGGASSEAGTTSNNPGAKPKGSMMELALAGVFFLLFVGAAIFGYGKMTEVDDVKFAMADLEMSARNEKISLEEQKTELESQIADLKSSHSMELADKDKKIQDLETRIAELENKIKTLETQTTANNMTETDMKKGNETTINKTTINEASENKTNETIEVPDEYQEYAENPPPLYTNETQQMYFPNETIDYDLSQDMWLPVYVFNPNYEEQYMQVRITCFDLYEEQFTLVTTDCEWVGPRSEKEFQVYLSAYGSPISARLECYMEQYNADMACEEPVGGLVQTSFTMDAFDLSQ